MRSERKTGNILRYIVNALRLPLSGSIRRLLETRWLALALICCLTVVALRPALSGPWLLDDTKLQVSIEAFNTEGLTALANGGWREHLFLGAFGIGRPLAMTSFAINGLFAQEPFVFKALNLLLHLATATLVYLVTLELCQGLHSRRGAPILAMVVALLWALHPLHVSTAAYVVQCMTILSALFSLFAILVYTRLRLSEIT